MKWRFVFNNHLILQQEIQQEKCLNLLENLMENWMLKAGW